jgi:UDP-2-acetamido-2-deoxy-ribo-hexuluronate aminotransferase
MLFTVKLASFYYLCSLIFKNKITRMQNIQMVDLKRQYQHIKQEVDAAIAQVIDTTTFINGPAVPQFANNLATYLNAKHVIPCANGTDALQIAMMALGLQPGDEVITPSFTYIATVEVMALLGLKPVFAEVDKATFTMDVKDVESKITSKTKAIVPVHLYGHSADMEPILKLAQHHNIPVVEDNAQAIGGHYTFADGSKKANGTMGHIGCTSFFPSKNLGCYGDGGAMYTNDDVLAGKLKMIANHGQTVKYYHDVVGCNSRLDSMQAAVLDIKLKHLDTYCNNRRAVAKYYNEAFANNAHIITPTEASYTHHVYHQYTLVLEGVNRDKVQALLAEQHIPSMIYYPVPAHKQKMVAHFNTSNTQLAITDWLTERVISLPIHTELTPAELEYITSSFLKIIKQLA